MQRHIASLFFSVWFPPPPWPAKTCANGRVQGHAPLELTPVLSLALPSSLGIEKPHRRTEETDPCQRQRFREQPPAQCGIDHASDEVEVPRNLSLTVHRHIAVRCHNSHS